MMPDAPHSRSTQLGFAVKRAQDIGVALAGLVLGAPPMALIAAVIAASMGRPVIFRQQRAGTHGRVFTLYKFRTMRDERDAQGALLEDAARLTRVGKLLRQTSLDELPSLVNVLLGQMSLVGPRPLLVDYLPLYTPQQMRRHTMRPGITGLAQVSGRNQLVWEQRFELDVWYVDHWSLGLDLRILVRTGREVLAGRGVRAADHATSPRFTGPGPS